jgi:hypothetical protein
MAAVFACERRDTRTPFGISADVTELVHDEGHRKVRSLELLEQIHQRHCLGHEQRRQILITAA